MMYSTNQQAIARAKMEERFEMSGAPPTHFQVEMVSQCRPDEEDAGEFCVQMGCPSEFERGRGPGSDLCYPKCLPGYETNGMSRCYKKCPEGYKTEGTQCIRPRYTFKKDTKACAGCNPRHKRHIMPEDGMADSWGATPPELMVLPTLRIDQPVVPVRPTVWTTNPIATKQFFFNNGLYSIESFEGNNELSVDGPDPSETEMTIEQSEQGTAMPESTNSPSIGPNNVPATTHVETKQPLAPAGHRGSHCPAGYTLYNDDQCYENCPPHYKDEGNQCTLDSYVMNRESYDRGGGVPFRRTRVKHHRLNTMCNKD